MSNGDPAQRPINGERRAAARDKARQLREAHRKQERRRRAVIRSTIITLVVAAAAIVAVVIVSSIHEPSRGPANMASDGILIGKGMKVDRTSAAAADAKPVANKPDSSGQTVSIVTYVDYLCPLCGDFERTNADQIGKLVDSGAATIEIHPIPLLASHSNGTKYSLRADNAVACVANYDPDSFWALNKALFENQPQENTAGLTDQQLKSLVKQAGAKSYDSIVKCIDDGRFEQWAQNALDRTLTGPIPNTSVKQLKGTPLVLVNGKQYDGSLTDADEFRGFIVKAQADTYSTPKPTPTPTATSTR
ncbi:DsbA family protein [Rathayibacter sp. CAU 1779]